MAEALLKKKSVWIVKRLLKIYPAKKTLVQFKTPFELLILTMLSARCTDVSAIKVGRTLFKKYKNAKGFAGAKLKLLEKDVMPAGLYKAKSRNIISSSRKIVTQFSNKVPDSMERLLLLDGVGRKTANIILSNAFKKSEGIAVDTHVRRLSLRLGLAKSKKADDIEKELISTVPPAHWIDINRLFVSHGRAVCRSQKPLCSRCVISKVCSFFKGHKR